MNGDLTGPEGSFAAPGWSGTISPDINDDTGPLNSTPGYVWVGLPLISPNGGTWQNLWGPETIQQSVVTVPGQLYEVCFYYAAQSITLPGQFTFDDPVGIEVYVNGPLWYSSPLDTTEFTWESACTTIHASGTTTTIAFGASTMNYVAIDGACMTPLDPTGMPLASGPRPLQIMTGPGADVLRVVDGPDFDTVTLTDIRGCARRAPCSQGVIDVRGMAAGMYVVMLWSHGKAVGMHRVVVGGQ